MKELIKIEDGLYRDKETGEEFDDARLVELVKSEEAFTIFSEDGKEKITDAELAAVFIRTVKQKSDAEKFLSSIKSFIESGKTTATSVLQDFFYAGYGAFVTTEKKAREWVEQMVESGKISREKGEEWYSKFKDHLTEREKQIEKKVKEVVQKSLGDLGIATRSDLEKTIAGAVDKSTAQIKEELEQLKKQVASLTREKT